MENQITPEWIAEQRQISEIVDMVCEDAPGSVVPLLKQLEKSQAAALDALEASMQREAEKDATIAALRAQVDSLTAERDAAIQIIRKEHREYQLNHHGCKPCKCVYCENAPTGAESDVNKNGK